MIAIEDAPAAITKLLQSIKAGVSDSGLCQARVRTVTVAMDIAFPDTASIQEQVTLTEPLADSVTTTAELKSTQRQEVVRDDLEQTVQRGGDKIFGRTSTSTE